MEKSELRKIISERKITLNLVHLDDYDMKVRKLLFFWCCYQRKIRVVFYKYKKLKCGKHKGKVKLDTYYDVCPCCKGVSADTFSNYNCD